MIGSASGRTGPLAASATILHFIFSAIFASIWFSRAPGTSTSQSAVRSSSVLICELDSNPTTVPVLFLCSRMSSTLAPPGIDIDPFESLAAMTVAPSFSRYLPAYTDALPNPCSATFAPLRPMPRALAASLTQYAVPRPVATFLASEPPMSMSLPVITPGICLLPLSLLYTSMICTISVPVVYTSGAGMSFSGPMISAISNANRLVILSFSPALRFSFFGLTYTPPLPPPSGTSTTAHFHVIQDDSAMTSRSM